MWKAVVAGCVAICALMAAPAMAQSGLSGRVVFDQVAREVTRYPHFTIFDEVGIAIDDNVVTLTGHVTMPYKRTDLERTVSQLEAVRAVHNLIEVLPASSFDDDLRYRTARAIYSHPAFWNYAAMPNPPIHVIVRGGRVRLSGVVQNELERMLARTLAAGSGALSVENALRTDREARRELDEALSGDRGTAGAALRLPAR